ncbi:hypothetical protein H4W30_001347 [Amycolatopsis roodepoortensis]|uniref:FAD-binding PCMH-type domain-containing protein n=1 Tax=Amycolatopsis roodepoortensis TaxID=700274 RepID=A0ABR9L2I8_9PSEU|nr:hypothetical protein [Amycolatopsis roodepoortensis]
MVQAAARAGKRLTVRSGGHCYEDFVDDPESEVIVDLSQMTEIRFDARRRAFAVDAGTPLGKVYETLFKNWGVTVPGGSCPTVAVGGHVVGGGYGPLNRLHGLIVDHLYAVEVVVVDRSGRASLVYASRERSDPNRDLWWAHTGGGGGNFGIVTRYWFRTPGATGSDPARLLPRPPARVWVASVNWPWAGMSEASFTRLLRNYGAWHEQNSDADSPYAGLFSRLGLMPSTAGVLNVALQMDATVPGAEKLIDEYLAALGEGVDVTPFTMERQCLPWWRATTWLGLFTNIQTAREDFKSAYMRANFTPEQAAAFYRNLTSAESANRGAVVSIASYGGRTNTVASSETAVAHRDSIMKLLYVVGWTDPAQDEANLAWIRRLYREVYAGSGGVPVPDETTDGCFVNYCDTDLSDPEFNKSGVPWSTLYYKENYPRLRRIKGKWDPRDFFRHGQSVEPAVAP